MKKKLFFVVFIFLELMVFVLLTPTSSKAYQACTDTRRVGCDSKCDASKGNKSGKGQQACVYACTTCGENTSGIECPNGPDAIAPWSGMEECDISGGGSGGVCPLNANRLSPALSDQCSSCIASKRQQTIRDIRSFGDQQNACSDLQVLSYWCNGGVSQDGVTGCNDVKNGDCASASACGGSTSVPPVSPLPAAQNLRADCSSDGTVVTATWDSVSNSVAYVVRVNADPWEPWRPIDLGTYTGTIQTAPTTGSRDFIANAQGNTSTTYKAKIVTGLGYNLSIQGVRQDEAYPYKGQYAGVDFTCTPPSVTSCSVSGDIDGNGRIEQADFDKWKNAFVNGNPITNTLHNCDGVAVDLVLFNTWRSQFARQ